ncbi:MAG: MFS transporter [Actinomycetota bacterium]|nr:MFS transporter [Actinomycetota bacterium]
MDETGPATGYDGERAGGATYREVVRERDVRILAISRFMAKTGISVLAYGTMVYLARGGASQFQLSLANGATFLAALLFGFQGGQIADTVPKRVALGAGFGVQAALCVLTPTLFGTGIGELLLLIFVASALAQVVAPGLKAAVAVVSTPAQLATAGALVSVIGSIGSAIGSAFIAPILIKTTGIEVVLYVSGGLFAIGAVRVLALPEERGPQDIRAAMRDVDWKPRALSLTETARWVVGNREVGSMILIGAIVVALYQGFNTLLPVFVRDVLQEDPANTVYIFAPAGLGFLAGALYSPRLMHWFGERRVAVVSLGCMAGGMMLFGILDTVAPVFAVLSPLRLLELFGITVSTKTLAAGVIAIPTNFGSTAAGAAIQTFINRRVPVEQQGAIFGVEQVQTNALCLAAVMLLGAVSTFTGPRFVYLVAPVIVIALIVWLVVYSYRSVQGEHMTRRQALDTLFSEGSTVSEGSTGP